MKFGAVLSTRVQSLQLVVVIAVAVTTVRVRTKETIIAAVTFTAPVIGR